MERETATTIFLNIEKNLNVKYVKCKPLSELQFFDIKLHLNNLNFYNFDFSHVFLGKKLKILEYIYVEGIPASCRFKGEMKPCELKSP